MSRTEIYHLGKSPGEIGTTGNAWRSAMQVWNYVAKRYCDMESMPLLFGEDKEAGSWKVWRAWQLPAMPEHEKIVLMSTLDKATVRSEHRDRLVAAFRRYAREQGTHNTSIGEQAEIIASNAIEDGDLIAWNQTSVATFWGVLDDPDNPDEWRFYDPSKDTGHWDIFDSLQSLPTAADAA